MSPRKLPVESAHWWPITDALDHRSQRRCSDKLAAQDVHLALRKPGRLRALVQHEDGRREPLPAAAWEDLYFVVWPSGGPPRSRMAVFSRKLGSAPRGCRYFVWLPDYEKIFGPVTASTEPHTQPQEEPVKRGKKPVHDRADLQSAALGLALQRKHGAPEKKQTDVVGELREWCKRNKRKVPVDSTLYDIVAAAFRIKPTLKG
jgi:hypothetical protein